MVPKLFKGKNLRLNFSRIDGGDIMAGLIINVARRLHKHHIRFELPGSVLISEWLLLRILLHQ